MKKLILLTIVLLILPFLTAGDYGAGSYSAGVYSIGEVISAPPSGGGGGVSVCTYDWQCTNWFPTECPESEIQERICANKGTCTGIIGMPNQTRTCIYKGPTEPIFDIFLTISDTEICAGKKIKANIKLENYGKIELLDAFMTYWVLNQNNTLIAELKDTRAVEEGIDFNVAIQIPKLTPKGTYRLYAQIIYSDNKTAVAGESFKIIDGISCKLHYNILIYLSVIFTGLIFLIIIALIIRKIKKNIEMKKGTSYKTPDKKFIPIEKISSMNQKEIKGFTKRKLFERTKRKGKPVSRYPKTHEGKKRLKKKMFIELLKEKIKLKKER